jgi:PAS domain S-box-containing protein
VTTFLICLSVALAALLWLQHRRGKSYLRRLSDALTAHDRGSLGDGRFHRAPAPFRKLEKQIFEQLFETENLEQRINRRERLLEVVVEGLGDAVIVFDQSLHIRFINPSATRLFGWDPERPPLGKDAGDCISNPGLVNMLEDCVAHGRHENTEILHSIPGSSQGSRRNLEVDVAAMQYSDSGTVTRARVVLHDVSAAHELEQVRKDFVANASHELRTPLTVINGYLENLIDSEIEDRDQSLRFLGVMQKHGDRIARIIEDMLTISKLESDVDIIERTPFDLRKCALEVKARLAPLTEAKSASIQVDLPQGSSEISGDAFYWDQIFFNIIENAIKENDALGLEVRVSIARTESGDQITISDDGVGIPKAARPFIFKRFYRVDTNRGADKKGTGLGLSIVKRAVEAHGGTIGVDSTPGVRTAFTISLPHSPSEEDADLPG